MKMIALRAKTIVPNSTRFSTSFSQGDDDKDEDDDGLPEGGFCPDRPVGKTLAPSEAAGSSARTPG